MNLQDHYQQTLLHYVDLAKQDAWRQYVWHQVKTMAREAPDLYRHLPGDLIALMPPKQLPEPTPPPSTADASPPPKKAMQGKTPTKLLRIRRPE